MGEVQALVRGPFSSSVLFRRQAYELGSLLLGGPRDLRARTRGVSRMVVGVGAAALNAGDSVVLTVEGGSEVLGLPALGSLCFSSSAAVGGLLDLDLAQRRTTLSGAATPPG